MEEIGRSRVLGVDLGARRIGLALSDRDRVIAMPHSVIQRGKDHLSDHRAIVDAAEREGAGTIVVGLPLSLSGRKGPAARAALTEVDELRSVAGSHVEVVVHDERLTTVTAERALQAARVSKEAQRDVVDKVAAAVMLQSWLDADGERAAVSISRGQRTAIVVVGLVVLPLCVLAVGAGWFWWEVGACGGGTPVAMQVSPGWGIPKIGDELHKQGFVGNSLVFSVYARLNGDTSFEAGTYKLKKHSCVRDVVRELKAGPQIDYTEITIPPGLWLKEIAQRVARLPGRHAQAFTEASENNAVRSVFEPDGTNNLEGLLWPDTYKVAAEEDEIDVLKTMVQLFDKRMAALGVGFANVQGHGPYDVIKIASLIEAEAKVNADRPLIASVIYNRLAQHMNLQVDATLIYARGDPANRKLSNKDKLINSPYNTYTHPGLPPTPIAAVSIASIEAALHPAQTQYLYYVVIDKTGKHAFATTLQEQEQNIAIAHRNGVG